ncbi:MAG: hypothetical protein F7B60_05210 [Desulfurococcales archaeon]|nr:hypothetical protein [Desulfurococcales archaeon]
MRKLAGELEKFLLCLFLTTIILQGIHNLVLGEGAQLYQVSYFITINYIPIGSMDVKVNPYNRELSLIKYHPSAPQYNQLEQAVFYLLKISENYCSTGHTYHAEQALTYYVESFKEMYVVKASRVVKLGETTDGASLQSYNYYPGEYCIPLFGRIEIYRNNVLVNELSYTILSSSNILPESNSLNSGPIRLFILTSAAVITTISLLVISKAGKYRII